MCSVANQATWALGTAWHTPRGGTLKVEHARTRIGEATRLIDTISFGPQLTVWQPIRALRLLDLTGTWALRNQAAHALDAAPRSVGRAWARTIAATWPDLDGLWVASTMTGEANAVLWSPAADALPGAPEFSRPLADPTLYAIIARIAATELAYGVD